MSGRDPFIAEREEWFDAKGFVCRVDLWDVAHVFERGHRIRLEVSSRKLPAVRP